MSLQSYARKHPIILGIWAGVFLLIFVPVGMSVQGFPVATILNSEVFPKLAVAAVSFGALMALFAFVLARIAGPIDAAAAQHRRIISIVSIVLALVLFYFIVK